MKVRQGFVSNSSSSSFVIASPVNIWDKVYNQLTPFEKAVADALVSKERGFGQDIMVISEFSDNGGGGTLEDLEVDYDTTDDGDDDDDYNDNVYEAYSKITDLLEKEGGDLVFIHSEDW